MNIMELSALAMHSFANLGGLRDGMVSALP